MATKTDVIVNVMTENFGRPAEEIFPLIVDAIAAHDGTEYTIARAKSVYVWCIKNERAAGVLPVRSNARKEKAPKVKAAKKIKVPNTKTVAVSNEVPVQEKTPEEIEVIRAANLAKIKEVHARMIAKGTIPNSLDDEPEEEMDEEIKNDFPKFLTKEQVEEML